MLTRASLHTATGPLLTALLAVLMASTSPTVAEEAEPVVVTEQPPARAAAPVKIEDLEAQRAAVEADSSLAADIKPRVLDIFTRSIDELRAAAGIEAEMQTLVQDIDSAPQRIEELKELAAREAPELDPSRYANEPLERLTAVAREKGTALEEARSVLTEREKKLASLTSMGTSLSEAIAEQKRTLRSLDQGKDKPPSADELPVAREGRLAYLAARKDRLSAQIAYQELQLANRELLVRLATLERDAIAVQVPLLDAEREALGKAVETKRAEEARIESERAKSKEAATASLPPAVAQLATENASLREELETVTRESGQMAERLRSAERQSSELESELASIRERVDAVGGSEAIGRLLRRRLRTLAGVETGTLRTSRRADEIVRATDRRIDLTEKRRGLTDLKAGVDEVLAQVRAGETAEVPGEERSVVDEEPLRAEILALLTSTRKSVDELNEAYGRYLTELRGYDAAERGLATTANTMRKFIRQELIWIRNIPPLALSDFAGTPAVISLVTSPQGWHQVLQDGHRSAASHPVTATLILCALAALLAIRPWARRKLAALGQRVSRIRTDAFHHTVIALLLTLAVAAAWPLLLLYVGWELGGAAEAAPFSQHAAHVLVAVAKLMILSSAAFWLFHLEGVARRHFRLTEPVRMALVRELRWLVPIAIVGLAFVTVATELGTAEALTAVGRPALMVFAIAMLVSIWRLFRPSAPLMQALRRNHPEGLMVRTWRVWFALLLAIPAFSLAASVTGYHYTANVVLHLMVQSGWLVLGVSILRDLMLRWFTVAERRLRFQQALKQRDEARAERERLQKEGGETHPAEVAEVEVPELDYRELGSQGRAVVQAAVVVGIVLSLWTLWADLLPALNVLDTLQLPMSRTALVDGVEQRVSVTATDLLFGLLVLAGTLFAAKNLSGFLGFTLLRRLTGDAGAQYAIVTLCQYAMVAAAAIYMFSVVGVDWSKLQWLVAALGVGLGFGLQEIVANFVSGIILLIERPVRVGDTVTVGDATGTVSRIRIRATTIVDWDRKELVVPNKEFITGRLLNWTLSNDIVRLVVPVGVAYGSDVRKARELLLEAAEENEWVLEDPPPRLAFNNFGDNALGLQLRVYLPSLDHWLTTQTALHDAIYEKLAAAGIGISFPQRDVHLDTNGPIDVRMHSEPERGPRRPWRRNRRPA